MSRVADSTAQWEFSTRTRGEVLIAEARGPGIYLALLGVPPGFTPVEIEGWLHDVAGVARETAAGDTTLKAIPALLHHALTGMLFSHAELWHRHQPAPASVVFVREGDEVGFGWVGEAEIAVLIDDRPAEIHWVTVRDEEGREARAWSIEADRAVRARIVWSERPQDPESAAARVEASWHSGTAEEPSGYVPASAPPMIAPPARTPIVPDPSWVDLDEEGELLDRDDDAPPPESESRTSMGSFGPVAELPPDFPAQIPPITGSTTAGVGDPRAISLPLEGAPAPPPFELVRPVPFPMPPMEPFDDVVEIEVEEPEPSPVVEEEEEEPFAEPPPEEFVAPAPRPMEAAVVVVRSAATRPAWVESLPVAARPEPVAAAFEAESYAEAPIESAAAVEPVVELPVEAVEAIDADVAAAEAEAATRPRRAPPLSPDWPSVGPEVPWWRNRWVWVGAAAVVLLAAGWLVGSQEPQATGPARARVAPAWMRALGLGGPRFELTVRSRPEGAWISVDGRPPELRTPAIIELIPGEHTIALSLPSLGQASYTVNGRKDEPAVLDASLTGRLEIYSPDPGALIAVAVDGAPQGFAPLTVDSLLPGAHEVRFSGPGMASWGQTVEIVVGETKQVLTRPLRSPATGLLLVRATLTESGEPQPLDGARVWIDGAPRGFTPLQLELDRGPHSIRVARGDQEAPIQVIDLPGGNQRFADFELGLDLEVPRLSVTAPARIPADPPVVVSAALEGMVTSELREMWLHVRTPDGPWRRYAMEILKTPSGVAGAVVFPAALLDGDGKAPYYVSAITAQGDEYYTEMRTALAERTPSR